MKLHNTIIYLIGIPAVGKYTVAKEIGRMTGAKVVDNQLINFPVYSVTGYDGTANFRFPQGAESHIEKIQRAVLAVIRDFCPPDDSFVFTNVLDAKAPGDKAWFRRIERLAWYVHEFEVLRLPHPNALTLDTSRCRPEQTAQRILEHAQATDHTCQQP